MTTEGGGWTVSTHFVYKWTNPVICNIYVSFDSYSEKRLITTENFMWNFLFLLFNTRYIWCFNKGNSKTIRWLCWLQSVLEELQRRIRRSRGRILARWVWMMFNAGNCIYIYFRRVFMRLEIMIERKSHNFSLIKVVRIPLPDAWQQPWVSRVNWDDKHKRMSRVLLGVTH